MNLSGDQQQALEAKMSLIRRDRDYAAAHAVAAIKRDMAARGMFGSGANLQKCWESIRAQGLKAASAAARTCVQVGARDAREIYEYVKADYLGYLRSFNEAKELGSSATDLLEAQLRSQAETEAARFYEEARSLLFDNGQLGSARGEAATALTPPALARGSVAVAPPHASGVVRLVQWLDAHPAVKATGILGSVVGAFTLIWQAIAWIVGLF